MKNLLRKHVAWGRPLRVAAGILAVGLLPGVGSANSVTLVDAKTRNGSFESGKLLPWQAVDTDVKFIEAKPPVAPAGKRYVAIENVASSGRGAAGYLINHRLPARERDGQHFELEYIAWSDGKDRFHGRSAYLVFKKGKDEVVKTEIIDQGPITTEPKTYRTVFSTSYSGWDSVDLRIILRRSGPSGTRGTGYLDGVTLRQSTESPKSAAP